MSSKRVRPGATQGGRASEQRAVGQTAPRSPNSSAGPPEQPLAIIVAPVGRGRFRAWLDRRPELVRSSSTPFLSACRKLLELGYDPTRPAVMRHCGTNHDAVLSTIGAAARLTVREDGGGPRFAHLTSDAPPPRDGSSSITPTTSPVPQPPHIRANLGRRLARPVQDDYRAGRPSGRSGHPRRPSARHGRSRRSGQAMRKRRAPAQGRQTLEWCAVRRERGRI
jgi:hypothetical protein